MGNESKCKNCKFAIIKEPFYDVKCMKLQRYIYDANVRVWCDYYEEKKSSRKVKEDND